MLAPETLNELVRRDSGLTTSLTTAAWPSLSVESKLQVVQRVSEMNPGGETPLWLVALALGDPNEIVRVWGLRWTTLRPSGEAVPPAGIDAEASTQPVANTRPTELEASLHSEALADRSALVRASVRGDGTVGFHALSAMSHVRTARIPAAPADCGHRLFLQLAARRRPEPGCPTASSRSASLSS